MNNTVLLWIQILFFQETILHYSFSEVLSTRRYRSDNGDNYLDMKLGNLMVQKIVRIETNQVCKVLQIHVLLQCKLNLSLMFNSTKIYSSMIVIMLMNSSLLK